MIIVCCIGLQRLTEPMFIKLSYNIFVNRNNSELTKLNNIMLAKNNGDLLFIPNSKKEVLVKFIDREVAEIEQLISGTNISRIVKDDQMIFYQTFSMLDVSHGVYYFYGKNKPNSRFKHISGNWYF